MSHLLLMLIAVLALLAIARAIWQAPEGYENEAGFHYSQAVGRTLGALRATRGSAASFPGSMLAGRADEPLQ
jgi:hypothetical protein